MLTFMLFLQNTRAFGRAMPAIKPVQVIQWVGRLAARTWPYMFEAVECCCWSSSSSSSSSSGSRIHPKHGRLQQPVIPILARGVAELASGQLAYRQRDLRADWLCVFYACIQVAVPRSRAPLRVQNLRVNNVEIPNSKRVEISLQYIYGIGSTTAKQILVDTVSNPATTSSGTA
jgi:hypothetical protein